MINKQAQKRAKPEANTEVEKLESKAFSPRKASKLTKSDTTREQHMFIAFLRAINVGGNNMIPMPALREMLSSPPLNFLNVQTLLQTGNIVFGSKDDKLSKENLTTKIQDEIESQFGVRSIVMLRTLEELKSALSKFPFPVGEEEGKANPSRVLLMFLEKAPKVEGLAALEEIAKGTTDKFRHLGVDDPHLYFHHPDGIASSKLAKAKFDRLLGAAGTARNWNTITKLIALAESSSK